MYLVGTQITDSQKQFTDKINDYVGYIDAGFTPNLPGYENFIWVVELYIRKKPTIR
jgi:hypothetical protein